MQETTARERILKKVRSASLVHISNDYENVNQEANVYTASDDDPLVEFAGKLNNIGGSFVYCENVREFTNNLSVLMKAREENEIFTLDNELASLLQNSNIKTTDDEEKLKKSPIIITKCEALVARTGSVVISSAGASGRRANFLPETHIVVAEASQVVETVKEAMKLLEDKYDIIPSMISFITGPSRTADIEKTLVMGAHGPRELIVFVVEKF